MKKKLTWLKMWIALKIFRYYYSSFVYPFARADDLLASKVPEAKIRYCKAVKDFIESEAYQNEMQSAIRHFYKELSLQPTEEPQFTGYRLTLIFIQYLEKRLIEVASRYDRYINRPNI